MGDVHVSAYTPFFDRLFCLFERKKVDRLHENDSYDKIYFFFP